MLIIALIEIDPRRTYTNIFAFRLELSKKKLAFLTFDQIKIVSLMLINDWGDMSEAQEPTLDREFLSSLKDIKVSATSCMIMLLAEPKNILNFTQFSFMFIFTIIKACIQA